MLGIRELRADLTNVVRRAGAGQRVVVTIGGRAVAQLGPVESSPGAATLDDLVAGGAVVAPRRHDVPRPTDPVPVWSGLRLDRALEELRG